MQNDELSLVVDPVTHGLESNPVKDNAKDNWINTAIDYLLKIIHHLITGCSISSSISVTLFKYILFECNFFLFNTIPTTLTKSKFTFVWLYLFKTRKTPIRSIEVSSSQKNIQDFEFQYSLWRLN